MIDFVYDLLAQGRFYYLETSNNQVFKNIVSIRWMLIRLERLIQR